MNTTIIQAGGIYNLILVVFHLAFWRLFDWPRDLRKLTFLNRAVMQVLNTSLIVVFVIFAWASLRHTDTLLTTPLGRDLLVLMTIFWLARSVQQVVFFKLRVWGSWAFLIFFLIGAVLYGVPALAVIRNEGLS